MLLLKLLLMAAGYGTSSWSIHDVSEYNEAPFVREAITSEPILSQVNTVKRV